MMRLYEGIARLLRFVEQPAKRGKLSIVDSKFLESILASVGSDSLSELKQLQKRLRLARTKV